MSIKVVLIYLLAIPLILGISATASSADTQITYLGHAAVRIVTPAGKIILVDPWITNMTNKNGEKDLADIKKADMILLTHGHGDHVGNTVEIARKTGAKLVTTPELMKALVLYSNFPVDQTSDELTGSFGGEISILGGEANVLFVPAIHGSSMEIAEGSIAPRKLVYAGQPGGFVITVKNGPRIYHTGDTDVFSEMSLIGNIDIMFACVGDKFTMGPQRAAKAVSMVKPKTAIPMHYETWPVLTGTPDNFRVELSRLGLAKTYRFVKTGETINWK